MYGSAGEQSTAEDLAKALRSALKRHSDRAVLESCGRALRALEKQLALEDAVEQRDAETAQRMASVEAKVDASGKYAFVSLA